MGYCDNCYVILVVPSWFPLLLHCWSHNRCCLSSVPAVVSSYRPQRCSCQKQKPFSYDAFHQQKPEYIRQGSQWDVTYRTLVLSPILKQIKLYSKARQKRIILPASVVWPLVVIQKCISEANFVGIVEMNLEIVAHLIWGLWQLGLITWASFSVYSTAPQNFHLEGTG